MSLTKINNLCGMNITLTGCNTQILPMRSNCTRDEVVSQMKSFCSMECYVSLKPDLLYKPEIHTLPATSTVTAADDISASVVASPPCLNISASDLAQNATLSISKLGTVEASFTLCNSHRREQREELAVKMAGMAVPGAIVIKACNAVGCSEARVRVDGAASAIVPLPTSTSPTPSTTPTESILTTAVAVNPNYWMMFGPLLACLILVVAIVAFHRCAKGHTANQTPDQALVLLQERNGV